MPQWNCGCRNCSDARKGLLPQMTQSSVAISSDGRDWVLLNASPDIRAQLAASATLAPRALRDTPISHVVLTNGDIDHIAGLLTLREKTPFAVCATQDILDILAENSVFNVMDADLVTRSPIALDTEVTLSGLSITPFCVPGKIALFKESGPVDTTAMGEQTIGLEIRAGGQVLYYVPGCAALPDWLVDRLGTADLLLFDGTVWENDDMQRTGTGEKTGARMGHISMTGADGSLARLKSVKGRRMFIHINNTNPVLQPDSNERAALAAAGWELALDGMEITL